MKRIMIGNDINLKYSVFADQTPEDLSNLKEIKVWLRHETIKALQIEPVFTIVGNVISMDVHAGLHKRTGAYRLFIQYKKNNPSRTPNYDSKSIAQLAFTLVETTEEAGGESACPELEPITIELFGDVGFGSISSGSGNVVVDNDSVILVNGKLTVNVVDSEEYDSDEYKSSSRPASAKQLRIIRELLESEYAKKTDIPDEPDLSGYVQTQTGKGLSSNDYTTLEKNKLENIAAGAEVNVNADWNASEGKSKILNKPDIDGSINSAIVPLKAKTDKIVTTGIGTQFLANDGTYKNVNAFANILEDEEFIGEYNVAQSVYNLYQTTFELSILPKVLGASTIFKISDRPLGFNVYLEVKTFSVSPVLKSALASFTQKGYEIVRVFVDVDLCTKIEVKCLENTSVDNKAVVQLQYVRDFGDILEFTVTVPSGVDASAVSLEFPKLKYNKTKAITLTIDDSYSIWNNVFSIVNKRWVDNEKMSFWNPSDDRTFTYHKDFVFNYNGVNYKKSDGYYPGKALEYSDGAGVNHRLNASVASWAWKLGTRDQIVGWSYPWVTADEARYMFDFGYTLNYHDIQGIAEYGNQYGSTNCGQKLYNEFTKIDAETFFLLTDRVPKVIGNPNGDPNYARMSWLCPLIQYQYAAGLTTDVTGYIPNFKEHKPFSSSALLDDKRIEKLIIRRRFLNELYQDFLDAISSNDSLEKSNQIWNIFGCHRTGAHTSQFLKDLENSYGVSGNDSMWMPSTDEYYEYWFMTQYGKSYKTIDGQKIKFKVYVPCGKNFWFRSISCLLSGISNVTDVSVVSSDNCFGTSFAINDGKLLVNLDFNPELPQRAEKYVSILEADKTKEYAYDDAQYFVQMLKPGIKEAYQSRIDALVSKPVLNSISVNTGATSTESNTVSILFSYSAGAPSHYMLSENPDMSGGVWADFVSNPSFILSSGYGTKTLYAKLKNGFGETSIVSDSINYTEPVLNLTSLLINNGDVSTSNPSVILTFGSVGTATHYMVSASASFTGASWVAFTDNPTFTLDNAVFGIKTVYAKLKNSTVETAAVSDTITLVNPNEIALNSVAINNGDENTASLNVSVSLGITNTPTHYKIGESADLSAVAWQTFNASPLSYTLSGYGTKTVYVQLKNATSSSAILSDSITAIQPVTLNSILINNADVSTDNKTLSVALNYSGGTPTHYMVSDSSSFTGASWLVFTSSPISYTLTDGTAGNKTVYVKLKNSANESFIASDSINFEVIEPDPLSAVVSFLGGNYTNNNKINYEVSSKNGEIINRVKLTASSSYTTKQFKSNSGVLLPWYIELNSSYFASNSETASAIPYIKTDISFVPVLSGDLGPYPDIFISNPSTIDGASYDATLTPSLASKKSRIVFTLPNGTYKFKMLYSVGTGIEISSTDLQYCLYRIDASGIAGTPVQVGATGFTALNNTEFNAEISDILVTDGGTSGNVVFYMYNSKPELYNYRPGINLIKIIKVA